MNFILRVVVLGALMAGLAACSSNDDEEIAKEALAEVLVCPAVGVLSDASVMRVFAGGAAPENVAYDLEFMRASLLECELNKEQELTAKVRFEARAQSGPALSDNSISYPYFIAILDPTGTIISKETLQGEVKFKSGNTQTRFGVEYDEIKFKVPEGKDGQGYEILIGFQLTREQLDYIRAQKAKPEPSLIMQ